MTTNRAIINALTDLSERELAKILKVDPNLYDLVKGRLVHEGGVSEREQCEDSLIEFLVAAWPHIGEPGQPNINWHHEVIAMELEAQSRGELPNMVINQPPRTTKPVDEAALVMTRCGPVPLRDIVVGDEVLTHAGRFRKVLEVHRQGILPVLKVTTAAGREVRAAPDHPFLTTEGWVEIQNLTRDHVLAAASSCLESTYSPDELGPEAARFLGYMVGDGSVKYSGITFWGNDEAVLEDFVRCAASLGFGTNRKPVIGCRCPAITVNSNRNGELQRFLEQHELRGKDSYTKKVPPAVLRGSAEVVGHFLGAFATCDGHFKIREHRDGRRGHQVKLTTVSFHLARQLQHLCLRLGLPMRVRTKRVRMETERQPGGVYTSYDVQTTDQDTVAKFRQLPGLCDRKRIAIAEAHRQSFDTHLFSDPVVDVAVDGEAECRCLSVEGDQSFTANDLVVHNTLLVSVALPAWVWCQPKERWSYLLGPHVQFFCLSYGATLAEEIAVKQRRLILGEWYQKYWGHQVKLLEDQRNRTNFQTTMGGGRISNSIEGGILGRGGIWQIIDDPHHTKGAQSDVQRKETLDGMRSLVTRLNDPQHAARTLVMQRLHQQDATDYALENWGEVKHIMFPMRFDLSRAIREDPRQEDHELLWPDHLPESYVRREEQELGEYGCTPAESPVLMADLTLKPISEVRAGDEVVGFQTHHSSLAPQPNGRPDRRKLQKAVVVRTYTYEADVVLLRMRSGAEVRCTADHNWYQQNRGPDRPVYRHAKVGRYLGRICDEGLPELTGDELREAGWLGGFFDGDSVYGAKFIKEWDEIVSIEPDGHETVYALETTTGNYVVWGYASSNSAGQLQQSPVPIGGGIIKSDWWRLWPDDAEREAGFMGVYKCYRCNWEAQKPPSVGTTIPCPMCSARAERKITYPETSYRMLFVDTAYSEKDQAKNSWNAVTRWGIWHDRNESPRAMLMEMWRGRVPLRGGTADQREAWEKKPEKGLVEIVHEMATKGQVDLVLIEKKTRGVDLNHELERLSRPWPYMLDFFEPTGRGDKVARLIACQAMFTNELIWAPDKQWARLVIEETAAVPRGQFDDLADTVSGSLLYLREMGLLNLRYEFEADKRALMSFIPSRQSVRDMYEET